MIKNSIIKDFISAIKSTNKGTSPYDTTATVSRIDGNTAWVNIPGSESETPVKLTIAAQAGDVVQVRVSGGKAFITGNATAPPTDDKTAKEAKKDASKAVKSVEDIEYKIENGDFDGEDGQDGAPGADGVSVVKVYNQYCLANANAIPSGQTFDNIQYSSWQDTIPAYVSGKYYWTRTATVLSNGTTSYGTPVFDLTNQASAEADVAATTAASAASTAEGIANEAKTGVTTVQKHFWYDSTGAHVSDTENSVTSGNSVTISSNGIVMMRNGKLVTSWTGSSNSDAALNFYDCTSYSARTQDLIASYTRSGTQLYVNNKLAMSLTASALGFYNPADGTTLQALFGSTGAILYASGAKSAEFLNGSMNFYASDGTTIMASYGSSGMDVYGGGASHVQIVHLGYGAGTDSSGTQSDAPYYTIGERTANSTIGNYSIAAGWHVIASGFASHAEGGTTKATGHYSHAEGLETTASGNYSHAEGYGATASGDQSHAEGYGTTASGAHSHAEGYGTTASGYYSHAGGIGTVASYTYQTVVGKYNSNNSANIFEVGIGTLSSSANRKNGFAVDSSGNARVKGNVYVSCDDNSANGSILVSKSSLASKGTTNIPVYFNASGEATQMGGEIPVSYGGTGASTASAARTNLGVPAASEVAAKGTTTNLNNATSPGIYSYSGSTTNAPNTARGSVIVGNAPGGYVMQMALVATSSKVPNVFVRMYDGSDWSTQWTQIS